MGVFDILPESLGSDYCVDKEGRPTRLELIEIADGYSVDDIKTATGCPFRIIDNLGPMCQEPGDTLPERAV